MSRPIPPTLLVAFCLALVPPPSADAQGSLGLDRILSFTSRIRINGDAATLATLDVAETIRVSISENNQGTFSRDYQTTYTDGASVRHDVTLQISIVRLDGRPVRYDVSSIEGGQRVTIGRANVTLSPGIHTYVIRYVTSGALGFLADHDELYWNATGSWPVAIGQASAEIKVAGGVPSRRVRQTAFTGTAGANGPALTASIDQFGKARFESTAPLPPGERLTLVVDWPSGYFMRPVSRPASVPASTQASPPSKDFWEFVRSLPPGWWRLHFTSDPGSMEMVLVAVLLLLGYAVAWLLVGRDPDSDDIQITSKPPENLSPAAMRYVRFNCKSRFASLTRTFAAALLNMAVKKHVTIEQGSDGMFILRKGTDEPGPSLTVEEQAIAAALFTPEQDADYTSARAHGLDQLQKSRDPLTRGLYGVLNASVGGPDDAQTVHLRRASSRAFNARLAMINSLEAAYPRRSLFKTHWASGGLGLLVMIAVAIATLVRYRWPLSIQDEPMFGGYLFLLMYVTLNAADFLVASLEAVVPLDSFAMAPTARKRTLSAITSVLALGFLAVPGFLLAKATSLTWAVACIGMMLMREVFTRLLPAPTELGARLWIETEGFRMFLADVDAGGISPQRQTPALFEQFLPYAFALQCEAAWAKPFEGVSDPSRFTQSFVAAFYWDVSRSLAFGQGVFIGPGAGQ